MKIVAVEILIAAIFGAIVSLVWNQQGDRADHPQAAQIQQSVMSQADQTGASLVTGQTKNENKQQEIKVRQQKKTKSRSTKQAPSWQEGQIKPATIKINGAADPRPEPSYTIQGDSLSVITHDQLLQSLPTMNNLSYSAAHGRSYPQGAALLHQQPLGDIVVFNLGTNSWLSDPEEWRQSIRQIIDYVGPERCLVMSTLYRKGPLTAMNQVIREEASRVGPDRFQIADWEQAVLTGQVNLEDGIHPTSEVDLNTRTTLTAEAIGACADPLPTAAAR